MSFAEILILIGALYVLLGSLILSGNTLMAGEIPSVKATLFSFFCWPYYGYSGLRLIVRRAQTLRSINAKTKRKDL